MKVEGENVGPDGRPSGAAGEDDAEMAVSPPEDAEIPLETVAEADAREFTAPEEDRLPEVEELLGRIPPAVLAAMDEFFRAKWTGVRRIPGGALEAPADAGQ